MPADDSKPSKPKPGRGAEAAAREAERRARLAAALRENLKRRKARDRDAKPASAPRGEPSEDA
jgi:hypothetical protein